MASVTTTGPKGSVTAELLRGNRKRRRKEATIRRVFFASALVSIVISLAIVAALAFDAIFLFLTKIDLSQLWTRGWFPRRGMFDIPTIFIGTFLVSAVAMLVATPLGLGAAIYLAEYAKPGARRVLKPILETLAGIPSVVIGFFALTIINPYLVQDLLGASSTFTIVAAGIGVGILTVPLVATVTEDALHAVPGALREAAYGVGARKRTVITKVVVPAAVSGIMAALILGLSRAVGETMVVAIAAGGTGGSLRTWDIFGPGQTMTGAIAALATGSDQVQGSTEAFNSLYFVGLLLFFMTLTLNAISERFVRRVRKQY